MDRKEFLFVVFVFLLQTSILPQSQPQIYITGTVVLDGGGTLPSAVQVQLKCHGSVVQSIYTSPDGRFTFRMNERTGENSPGPGAKNRTGVTGNDASIGGPATPADIKASAQRGRIIFRQTDLSSCKCQAFLAGYQSEVVHLAVRSHFEDPDIGTITLTPMNKVTGTTVSITTSKAPKNAKKAFQKAQDELSKENAKHSKVIDQLVKATEIYPEFAEAWQLLGETYFVEGKEIEARKAFQRACEADPMFVRPYAVLGELHLRANEIEEAARLTGRAIELNPYLISAQYIHAIAQYYLGKLDEAEESLLRVQESSEAHFYPASHRLLGGIYSERKKYSAAAEEFRRFLETDPPENDASEVKQILGQWEQAGLI